jgi:predicted nuclease of predicted toxin-antitoxin system
VNTGCGRLLRLAEPIVQQMKPGLNATVSIAETSGTAGEVTAPELKPSRPVAPGRNEPAVSRPYHPTSSPEAMGHYVGPGGYARAHVPARPHHLRSRHLPCQADHPPPGAARRYLKFLIDAQLASRPDKRDHDAVHKSELPNGNRTTDTAIAECADAVDRVVVTKDRDFRDSHLLGGTPRRLLVVTTGNITNDALLAPVDEHLDTIVCALEDVGFIELRPTHLIVHEDQEKRPNPPPD